MFCSWRLEKADKHFQHWKQIMFSTSNFLLKKVLISKILFQASHQNGIQHMKIWKSRSTCLNHTFSPHKRRIGFPLKKYPHWLDIQIIENWQMGSFWLKTDSRKGLFSKSRIFLLNSMLTVPTDISESQHVFKFLQILINWPKVELEKTYMSQWTFWTC